MADVNTGDGGGGHGKHEKKRAKKSSTRIDMTPMVDLAFLLLTFFVMTSTFNKSKILDVPYPVDPEEQQKPQLIKNAITFLLKGDKIFYYSGELNLPGNSEGKAPTKIIATDYSKDGIRKVLIERNKKMRADIEALQEQKNKKEIADSTYDRKLNAMKRDKEALTALIKPGEKVDFKNVIDVIDELRITFVPVMAVVDMTAPEKKLVEEASAN